MLAPTLNLAARVNRPSRKPIPLRNVEPTRAQALDLFALYTRVIATWVARKDRIITEYAATLNTLQRDSASTTGSAIDEIAAEIQRLVLLLTPDLRRWALMVEAVHRGKWARGVMSATDVDLSTILTPYDVEDTIDALVQWNTSLIRDVSDDIRRRIANIVFTGFQQRKSADAIAREIAEATDLARARSRRIASDQTVKLGSRLNQARQEQAGITRFKWRHSGKAHPRSWHQARNGQVYPWHGSGIPADDMPGVPPFCGCTAQGVVTFDD